MTYDESSSALPAFNSQGYLPKGIHAATWEQFIAHFGYNAKRQRLLSGLRAAIWFLQQAGCQTIYVGGSFVTRKQTPGDIDVLWEGAATDWRYLRQVAPVFFDATSARQKRIFGGEFFPDEGIEVESNLTFLEFFQRTRRGRPRGIVRIRITDIDLTDI